MPLKPVEVSWNPISAMQPEFQVATPVIELIRRAQRRKPPGFEVCGFLLGTDCGGSANIQQAMVVRNGISRTGGFSISHGEYDRARRRAVKSGLSLLAVFHTHPGGQPQPSDADRHSLASSPIPWVILSPASGAGEGNMKLAAYTSRTGEPLRITVG